MKQERLGGEKLGFFSNIFGKKECSICGNQVGVLKRDALLNKEGYICKECSKKCSALINVGRFTKALLDEHMEYMEKQSIKELLKKEGKRLSTKKRLKLLRDASRGIVIIFYSFL